MSVTIHDVAKKAGVGIGTVSSVLNHSRPVNETTRQKVLNAVAELDFVPNPSGRRLSMGKTQTIGVVIPFFTTPAQIERLRGVMSIVAASDYDIMLFPVETVAQRNKVFQTVPRRGGIDGLIIFSLTPTEDDMKRVHRQNIPTVLVEAHHSNLHSIYLDDKNAIQVATNYLISLGHRKIAYVGEFLDDPFDSLYSRNRYQGYCQAMKMAGLALKDDYFYQCSATRADARKVARTLLNLSNPPSAVICYSDAQALGILEVARDLNIDIPKDLSVIGYDDIETAHFAQLTTIRQHLFESGVEGINLLLSAIQKPEMPPIQMQFPAELIIRRTTAPPK